MLIGWIVGFLLGPLVLGAGFFLPGMSGASLLFQRYVLIVPSIAGTAFWLWVLPPELYEFVGGAFVLPLLLALL